MQPPCRPRCISASPRRRGSGTRIRRTSGAVEGRPRALGDSPVPFVTPFLVKCRVFVDHFFTRSPPVSPGIGLAGTEPRARACRVERKLRADTDGWSWPGSCLQRWPGPPGHAPTWTSWWPWRQPGPVNGRRHAAARRHPRRQHLAHRAGRDGGGLALGLPGSGVHQPGPVRAQRRRARQPPACLRSGPFRPPSPPSPRHWLTQRL